VVNLTVYKSICLFSFFKSLFISSPVKDQILVNDRWGWGTMGHHGSFLTGGDRWMPGHLIKRKWEYCMTLDQDSWGYRRDMTVGF
jgi:alpha-L-fucosidase